MYSLDDLMESFEESDDFELGSDYVLLNKIRFEKKQLKSLLISLINTENTYISNGIDSTAIINEPEKYSIRIKIISLPKVFLSENSVNNNFMAYLTKSGRGVTLEGEAISFIFDEILGKKYGNMLKREAEKNTVRIDITETNEKVVFKNYLSGSRIMINKNYLKEKILEVINPEDYIAETNIKLPHTHQNNNKIIAEEIRGNETLQCIKCDRIRDCEHLFLFSSTPFAVCESCYDKFLIEHLGAVSKELVSKKI